MLICFFIMSFIFCFMIFFLWYEIKLKKKYEEKIYLCDEIILNYIHEILINDVLILLKNRIISFDTLLRSFDN